MCLARPRFPVLVSLRGFLGQVFSGHPGTLTSSKQLLSLMCVFFFRFPEVVRMVYAA